MQSNLQCHCLLIDKWKHTFVPHSAARLCCAKKIYFKMSSFRSHFERIARNFADCIIIFLIEKVATLPCGKSSKMCNLTMSTRYVSCKSFPLLASVYPNPQQTEKAPSSCATITKCNNESEIARIYSSKENFVNEREIFGCRNEFSVGKCSL